MFASGCNYNKLKTNLRLCINRLKLLEKKKTELALKSRKEIADYLQAGKTERAKIRVEHIIREDYLVEAMELLEMLCDLLLARFGLIQQMKTLDDGLAEAISSVIWVAPRLQADVQELKIVSDQLSAKYGKPYALACRENAVGTVSEKLMHKLSVQAPPKITVEKYLVEIAKYYNVDYEPDPQIMGTDETAAGDALIELGVPSVPSKDDFHSGGPGGGAMMPQIPPVGGGAAAPPAQPFQYPQAGQQPQQQQQPGGFAYPPPSSMPAPGAGAAGYPPAAYPYQAPANTSPYPPGDNLLSEKEKLEKELEEGGPPPAYFPPDVKGEDSTTAGASAGPSQLDLPELPGIPGDSPAHGNTPDDEDEKKDDDDEDVDFDDLTKRFEALKKKK